ncbi:box C/D snoRNA protein 1 isoform X2 [Protopterus annectens]|uniref:box C/D snoRNA protein 1 isoform X2 n=1 Tax=Protopterus annectens TaxID=7888 RepID=UPI001CFA4C2C|nr:box C/D snoRNA protein 1 isoform X2 [Protopterus annectens]
MQQVMEEEEVSFVSEEVESNNSAQVKYAKSQNKMSLSRCDVCGKEEAKYRCPKCLKYSCSLPCVKKHKMKTNCTGVRDKTAFVSLEDFNEIHLLSDYRFLEDMDRLTDNICRKTLKLPQTSNFYLFSMKEKARKRKIDLVFLPGGFSKRKENTTCFSRKSQMFFWHLKLSFPQADAEYSEERVPDDKTLAEILKQYIDPIESDPVLRQRLQAYVQCKPEEVSIFMKAENRRCNSLRYHKLDISKSLLENFKNKIIIEYPTLYFVQKDHAEKYKVICQEDLISDAQMAEGNWQMETRDKNRTSEPNSMEKVTREKSQTDDFKASLQNHQDLSVLPPKVAELPQTPGTGPPPSFQNNQNLYATPSSNTGFQGTEPPPTFQNYQQWSGPPSWTPPATGPPPYFQNHQNWSFPSGQTTGSPGLGPPPTFHNYQNWSVPPSQMAGAGPPQPFQNYQHWSTQTSQTTGTPGPPHPFCNYQTWSAPSHNTGSTAGGGPPAPFQNYPDWSIPPSTPGREPPSSFQNNHNWSSSTAEDKGNAGKEPTGPIQNNHSWSSPAKDKGNLGTGFPAPIENCPDHSVPLSSIKESHGKESNENGQLKLKSTNGCSPLSDGSETEEGEIKDDSD